MAQVKVWDPFVRVGHWALALLVLGAFLTSDEDRLVHVHAKLGLAVAGLVLLRAAWGFVGTAPARFRAFVRGPRETAAYARALAAGRPPLHLSHNPLGGAMVVALLAVLAGVAVTGAAVWLGPEFRGPLTGLLPRGGAKALKEVHEGLTGLLLGMIGLHVAGVLFSSWREGQNLVLGMVTGRKRAPEASPPPAPPAPPRSPSPKPAAGAPGAGAPLGAVLALALALGLPGRAAAAGGPVSAALLREYEAEARRARPAFAGFSAEAGRRLHLEPHLQDGQPVSCATCHTADPRAQGLTPAGKVVDPLAPAANPARLTDRADVEKWFKRNCKQVLGRECSAEEKGNYLTWLLSA